MSAEGTEPGTDAFDGVSAIEIDGASVTEPAALTAVSAGYSSFDGFFIAHHDRMVRALTLALGDAELGRDASAEAFTKALQRWRKVSRYENPTGWIYRVGLNWGRSRLRKTRREVHAAPFEAGFEPAVADPTLVRALATLSADHRDVIVGKYYLDWSEVQLAAALDVPPGTVKSRLSRALHQLTDQLSEHPSGSKEPS